mmetsp:Transcript_95520/g.143112  ORF Transcript_95520/g.143112 Transcript_95520/m.143112 type:complete len:109 (-) Transcript_95520:91-417(-)
MEAQGKDGAEEDGEEEARREAWNCHDDGCLLIAEEEAERETKRRRSIVMVSVLRMGPDTNRVLQDVSELSQDERVRCVLSSQRQLLTVRPSEHVMGQCSTAEKLRPAR